MRKPDLRQLLQRSLVANTNQPARAATDPDRPVIAAVPVEPDRQPPRARDAPNDQRVRPKAGPPVRAHRALRPRRRS